MAWRQWLLTTGFDLLLNAMELNPCTLSSRSWQRWGVDKGMSEAVLRCIPMGCVTLAPKGHLAATLTPKCHPTAPDLSMQLSAAAAISGGGSLLQICLEPPACNLKQQNPFWLNFPLQDKAGPVLSQLHSHSALPGSYLQCPGSQLLRISAAQTSPACTSHSSLPCCQLQLASIMGLMYTTLALAPAMREGRAANGKQSSDDMRWSCAHSGKKK